MTIYRATGDRTAGVAQQIVAVVVVLLLSASLLWPAMLNGGPLIFFDTIGYLDQGRSAVVMVSGKFAAALSPADGGTGGGVGIAAHDASYLRSVVYPVFAYVGSLSPLGFTGVVFIHSVIVVVLATMIVGREAAASPKLAMLAAAICIGISTLPWVVSTLMPDVFAAVAILCAIIIATRLDRIALVGKLFVFSAASLATLSHYGHPPLFFAVAVSALLALVVQRRLSFSAVVLSVGPLAATFIASLGVSQAVFDESSIVPLRAPLLLARSMEDGPARWHLEEHCDEYGYAICDLWDGEFPKDLGTLLWSQDGLLKKPTDAQMALIREEEFLILKRTLIEYPSEQTWSFVGNAVRQMWMIGLEDTTWGRMIVGEEGKFQQEARSPRGFEVLAAINVAQTSVVLASAALILLYIVRDGLRAGSRERTVLFVALFGLAANAAIFGGLSAPVDRYQMRVIWIVPMVAALFWLARCRVSLGRGPVDV